MIKKQSAQITRQSKSNFASSFKFLPPEKREAIYSVYAWCRKTDDIVDSSQPIAEKEIALNQWQNELDATFSGNPQSPLTTELARTLKDFPIEKRHFSDMIDAMWLDIKGDRFESWEKLIHYCYGVAGTVGLMAIEIFEYKNKQTRLFASDLGIALQLTNIIRDVKRDAKISRIYIPLDIMNKHGVTEEDIVNSRYSDNYRRMMEDFSQRTLQYYKNANAHLPQEDIKSMRPSLIMGEIYYRLFKKLQKYHFDVLNRNISLPSVEKVYSALKGWFFPRKTLC